MKVALKDPLFPVIPVRFEITSKQGEPLALRSTGRSTPDKQVKGLRRSLDQTWNVS